jgi:hypothetical protein
MSWAYRITRRPDPSSESGHWFEVREVYYKDEVPHSHGAACVGSETLNGFREVLEMMELGLKKPVLDLDAAGKFLAPKRKS